MIQHVFQSQVRCNNCLNRLNVNQNLSLTYLYCCCHLDQELVVSAFQPSILQETSTKTGWKTNGKHQHKALSLPQPLWDLFSAEMSRRVSCRTPKRTRHATDKLGHLTWFRTASPAKRLSRYSVSKFNIKWKGHLKAKSLILCFILISLYLLNKTCFEKASSFNVPVMVWSCLPFIRSGQNHLARHSERRKKTRRTEERGGKTTSGNGQAWSSPSPKGQWRTGKNGGN